MKSAIFSSRNALFWLDQYHIDGLRVDAVASMLYLDYSRKEGQWIPNVFGGRENLDAVYFLKRFNEVCYERFPGIMTIAEESTAWPGVSRPTYLGGLGFGFKWNMGWMHDFLEYMQLDPIFRRFHHGNITFSLLYAFQEHFVLVLSHDEVVHGKRSLLFENAGRCVAEICQSADVLRVDVWSSGEKTSFHGRRIRSVAGMEPRRVAGLGLLQSPLHDGLRRLVQHLNYLYKSEPALWDLDDTYEGFEWIDFHDAENSVVAWHAEIARRRDDRVHRKCHAGSALPVSHWRSRRPAIIAKSSIPMPRLTVAATWAISAGLPPRMSPGRGGSTPFMSTFRPWRRWRLKKKEKLAS